MKATKAIIASLITHVRQTKLPSGVFMHNKKEIGYKRIGANVYKIAGNIDVYLLTDPINF